MYLLKICLIIPSILPVPAVKGGAIETLINNLIDINEEEKQLDITVISVYDHDADLCSKKYEHTEFFFLKSSYWDCILHIFYRVLVKFFNWHVPFLKRYESKASKIAKEGGFDFIINEAADFYCFQALSHSVGSNRMLLHLHSINYANSALTKIYGHYIAVSNYIKQEYCSKMEYLQPTVHVLKNGINLDHFSKTISNKEKLELRNALKLAENDFVVLFCGRIIPKKGVLELVEAILSIEDHSVKLILIGAPNFGKNSNTSFYRNINEMVSGHTERIINLGYIDNKNLYLYNSIADVIALPSLLKEAAPLAQIEAQASGNALITTTMGGIPEYSSKETAIYVDTENMVSSLKEKILYLKRHPKERKRLGDNGKLYAQQFSDKQYYQDFVDIVCNLGGPCEK